MFKLPFGNAVDFCFFIRFLQFVCQWYHSLFVKVVFITCSLKVHEIFTFLYTCSFPITSNVHFVDIEYPAGICSPALDD